MMEITLNEIQISDVFFNSEHPHMDAYYAGLSSKVPWDAAKYEEAFFKDVSEFAERCGMGPQFINWLLNDFSRRV